AVSRRPCRAVRGDERRGDARHGEECCPRDTGDATKHHAVGSIARKIAVSLPGREADARRSRQLNGGIGYGAAGDESSARCVWVTFCSSIQACSIAVSQAVRGVPMPGGGICLDLEQVGGFAPLMTAIVTSKRLGLGVSGHEEAWEPGVIQS